MSGESLPVAQTGAAPAAAPAAPGRPGEAAPMAGGGASVTDGQAAAGLTEVAIYGIVTFYEKYTPKAAGTTPAATKPSTDNTRN